MCSNNLHFPFFPKSAISHYDQHWQHLQYFRAHQLIICPLSVYGLANQSSVFTRTSESIIIINRVSSRLARYWCLLSMFYIILFSCIEVAEARFNWTISIDIVAHVWEILIIIPWQIAYFWLSMKSLRFATWRTFSQLSHTALAASSKW